MFWSMVSVLVIMANPLIRAKEFLTALKEEHDIKFKKGLSKTTIDAEKVLGKHAKKLQKK